MRLDRLRFVLEATCCIRILVALAALLPIGFAGSTTADADGNLTHRQDLSEKDRGRVSDVLATPSDFSKAEPFEAQTAGAGTNRKVKDSNAFSWPLENLDFEDKQNFTVGNGLFKKVWVSSPSSTQASDGLGPLYNARACQRCHLKDGRGHPPADSADNAVSMLIRLSVPPKTDAQRKALADKTALSLPEPTYGHQLQDFSVSGVPGEGSFEIVYEDVPVTLSGGEQVSLQKPVYTLKNLAYGPMEPGVRISPRIAPPMIGLGLLEAVHDGDILANSDPADANGDGISGKPSYVRRLSDGSMALGRFGWKASTAAVDEQSAAAFSGDMGLSTPFVPNHGGDCTAAQEKCLSMPHGEQPRLGASEVPDYVLALVSFYSRNLAPPARRDVEHPDVLRGKALFHQSGCAQCHVPKYVTRRDADQSEHAFQLIWPYTDLLLHDMGEGLADNQPVGDANGREWRTAPLWGIGLTEQVGGRESYLHDGRARTLAEAILWHGGEAEAARNRIVDLSKDDRISLIRFLQSL
ncbi:MAG: di-heme oxidoredictase family protein [Stappiaceae bacterium]